MQRGDSGHVRLGWHKLQAEQLKVVVPTGLQRAEMLWSTLALQEDQVQEPLSGLGTSYPKAGSLAGQGRTVGLGRRRKSQPPADHKDR